MSSSCGSHIGWLCSLTQAKRALVELHFRPICDFFFKLGGEFQWANRTNISCGPTCITQRHHALCMWFPMWRCLIDKLGSFSTRRCLANKTERTTTRSNANNRQNMFANTRQNLETWQRHQDDVEWNTRVHGRDLSNHTLDLWQKGVKNTSASADARAHAWLHLDDKLLAATPMALEISETPESESVRVYELSDRGPCRWPGLLFFLVWSQSLPSSGLWT